VGSIRKKGKSQLSAKEGILISRGGEGGTNEPRERINTKAQLKRGEGKRRNKEEEREREKYSSKEPAAEAIEGVLANEQPKAEGEKIGMYQTRFKGYARRVTKDYCHRECHDAEQRERKKRRKRKKNAGKKRSKRKRREGEKKRGAGIKVLSVGEQEKFRKCPKAREKNVNASES